MCKNKFQIGYYMMPITEVLQNDKMMPYETIVTSRFCKVSLGKKWHAKFIMIITVIAMIVEKEHGLKVEV